MKFNVCVVVNGSLILQTFIKGLLMKSPILKNSKLMLYLC